MTTKATLAALLALGLAGAAAADSGLSQIERQVARELPRYGFDVDVRDLNTTQLHGIYGALHRPLSQADKRAAIRSYLGGSFSLRGLLFGD